ncbi:MAG TPA: toll/interleukin-1 receptor domain-containing protein [Ktedonobacteraceae bacterium]|nr:toll/interleukin-1 receptor domain-containing protein [Ktedonobacteraceae bacterium]
MADAFETQEGTTIEIFCAYAQKDEPLQQELKTHLSNLQDEGYPLFWYDRPLARGVDWAQEIDQHINSAKMILLLISADFLATRYSRGSEMARAWERHTAGEVRIIPIILRAASWRNEPFARVQVLPSNAKPITSWRNQDEVFEDIAAALRHVLAASASRPTGSLSTSYSPELHRVWNVPFAPNSLVTAHEKQLAQIFAHLILNQCVAISGSGSSIRARLAVDYACRYRHEYSAVLWVCADTQETLQSSYRKLATLLKLRERDAKEQTVIVQAVRAWLEARKKWLLILDNLDDPAVLFPADEMGQQCQSSPFLPTVFDGHLLITTRASDLSSHRLGMVHSLAIITLTPE